MTDVNKTASPDTVIIDLVQKALEQADALMKKRKTWEKDLLERSNRELYAILEGTYALYKRLEEDEMLEAAVTEMKKVLKSEKIRIQSNTPPLTVLVRYIFGCDRKRAYNYVQTLESADQAKIASGGITTFIEENNGIEQCKIIHNTSPEVVERERKIEEVANELKGSLQYSAPLATVQLDQAKVTFADDKPYAIFVARVSNGGDFDVLHAVPMTPSLERLAMKEVARDHLSKVPAKTVGQPVVTGAGMEAAKAAIRTKALTDSSDDQRELAA